MADDEKDRIEDELKGLEGGLERRVRMIRLGVTTAIGVAIVAVFAFYALRPARIHEPARYLPSPEEHKQIVEELTSSANLRVYGNKGAEVLIQAIFPFTSTCHDRTVALARAFAETYPDHVRFELYNMDSPVGDYAMQKFGVGCAYLFINGHASFNITKNGKTKTVEFTGPEGGGYTVEDLYEVLSATLKSKWPDCPDPALPKKVYDEVMSGKYPGLFEHGIKLDEKAKKLQKKRIEAWKKRSATAAQKRPSGK